MSDSLNKVVDWRKRGYYLRRPPLTILAYDPAGDGNDNDALIILTREEHQRGEPWDPDFAVQTMFRIVGGAYMKPEYEFPDKVAQVLRIYKDMASWEASGRSGGSVLVVEANGIGYGMVATLAEKIPDRVVPYITIGATSNSPYGEKGIVMPRLSALSHLKMLLEQNYVRAAKGAFGMKEIEKEMNTFVWAGPKRPESLPGQRDDMVMALCGGVWIASKVIGPMLKEKKFGKVA